MEIDPDYIDGRETSPEEDVDRRDLLEFWFSTLTQGQELVMWLRYYFGMDRVEVAKALSACYNTVFKKERLALKTMGPVVDEASAYA